MKRLEHFRVRNRPERFWGYLAIMPVYLGIVALSGGCTFNVLPGVRLSDLASRPPAAATPSTTDPQPTARPSGIDWPTIIGGLAALGATAWVQYRATTGSVKTIVDTRKPSGPANGVKT